MNPYEQLQLEVFIIVLLLLTKPMGLYLYWVLEADGKTFIDPVMRPVERSLLNLLRVDPKNEQDWKHYTFSMLAFTIVGVLFTVRHSQATTFTASEPATIWPCL